jgi:hypothetical protein
MRWRSLPAAELDPVMTMEEGLLLALATEIGMQASVSLASLVSV